MKKKYPFNNFNKIIKIIILSKKFVINNPIWNHPMLLIVQRKRMGVLN